MPRGALGAGKNGEKGQKIPTRLRGRGALSGCVFWVEYTVECPGGMEGF